MTLYAENDVARSSVNHGLETRLRNELDEMVEQGVHKEFLYIMGRQSAVVDIDGFGDTINLCSNNYLGLCDEPAVIQAVKDGTDKYGAGTASVRFICGTFDIHRELESKIADFMELPSALTYTSAWNANEGLFAPLLSEQDVLISDQLNHACIIDGIRLCKAERKIYDHMNMDSLRKALESSRGARHRLVITDGIFSMEGEIAPLPDIRDLCERYDAILAVDDSHATGVLGDTGRGTPEHFGMHGEIDIVTSTLGKALGGMAGGFTASSRSVVDYLLQQSRTQLFTNALPSHSARGALAAIEHLEEHPELVTKLRENTAHFREGLEALGYKPIPGETPIVPVIIGKTADAMNLSQQLLEQGVFVIGFGYPVVPKGEARIRCQISAAHEHHHLDTALAALKLVGEKLGII